MKLMSELLARNARPAAMATAAAFFAGATYSAAQQDKKNAEKAEKREAYENSMHKAGYKERILSYHTTPRYEGYVNGPIMSWEKAPKDIIWEKEGAEPLPYDKSFKPQY